MATEIAIWALFGLGILTLLGVFSHWLLNNPRGTVDGGLIFHVTRIYSLWFHRLKVEGKEHIPASRHPGAHIVVMNHTAGVDPVLVQAICPFFVRYVMAEDMRLAKAEWLWQWSTVIFVDRVKRSAHGTRDAVRHLVEGGVLGIFPEGGLERPSRHILAFEPGVGLLIRRTGATVIPIIIEGTPQVDPAWASLWTRSHSRLRVMEPISYRGSKLSAEEIAKDLQRRFVSWTGWPVLEPSEQEGDVESAAAPAKADRAERRQPAAGAA